MLIRISERSTCCISKTIEPFLILIFAKELHSKIITIENRLITVKVFSFLCISKIKVQVVAISTVKIVAIPKAKDRSKDAFSSLECMK